MTWVTLIMTSLSIFAPMSAHICLISDLRGLAIPLIEKTQCFISESKGAFEGAECLKKLRLTKGKKEEKKKKKKRK